MLLGKVSFSQKLIKMKKVGKKDGKNYGKRDGKKQARAARNRYLS